MNDGNCLATVCPGRLAFCDLYQRKFLQVYYMDVACDVIMVADIVVTLVTVVPKVRPSILYLVCVCLLVTCLVLPNLTESVGVVHVSEYVQRSNVCGYKLPSNRDALFRTSISVELCANTRVPGAHLKRGDGVE